MNDNRCPQEECGDDPKYTTPIPVAPLPSNGGGGHEFVTALPDIGVTGVEYIVMEDLTDCDTFQGTYVWKDGCWVTTSGAGGGALDTYTFEETTTGWIAKKNNRVVFTYDDERITKLQEDVSDIEDEMEGVKHDIENLSELLEPESQNAITRAGNLPPQVVYNVDSENTEYKADNVIIQLNMKDLHTGGDATLPLTLKAACAASTDEEGNSVPAQAGIMTSFQATQLAALAEAYKNTTQGITLYEGSASVNYIDLSDNAWNYDHIVVVGDYMSEGSAAFHQSVSAEFYPNKPSGINTFQVNAVDIVANNTPLQTTLQDIWMLDEDGTELALVAGMKSTVKGGNTMELTVEPQGNSIFTITKVVGYGKKI